MIEPRSCWPAEWAPRYGTLLAWPGAHPWTGQPDVELVSLYTKLIKLLRQHEPVRLLVPPDQRSAISRRFGGEDESLTLEPLPCNDIWVRDCGPISVYQPDGRVVWLDGGFNGWGNKYPHELDALLPTVLARRWGQRRARLPIRLEGGAIEGNGHGDLITTASVLLNPNRGNPAQGEVERILRQWLGVERVHWLAQGLSDDHTDGHIDNLVRFVSARRLVCLAPGRPGEHPDHARLLANRQQLNTLRLAGGQPEIIELPTVLLRGDGGRLLPASYANFHLAPGLVLVPTFGDNGLATDKTALSLFQDLFPQHRIEGLDARALVAQGGGLHCITQPLLLNDH
jgi:agmatine deiminase